nr:LysR family transcriptional regulator [Dermabacter vaginalis]
MLSPRIPDLSALEMLAAVHDLGSLSAAGKHLGLSQQAVSSRMRSLESQIGSVLLTRTPRGSTLTESGALVAGWAAEVLAAAERLDAGIASLRSDTARQLKVAASQTIAEHLLPLWLVALRRQQESLGLVPTVVELTVNNSEATVALVRSGQAAIGFIESPHLPPDLSAAAVQNDYMVVVVAPDHPWARRRTPSQQPNWLQPRWSPGNTAAEPGTPSNTCSPPQGPRPWQIRWWNSPRQLPSAPPSQPAQPPEYSAHWPSATTSPCNGSSPFPSAGYPCAAP